MENKKNQRDCFVIMEFGKKDTEEYLRQRSIYEDIIKPAVDESGLGYTCRRADEIMRPGSVIKDIVNSIRNADVVIADLTGQNPNVFYELGVRHSLRGRTIMLTQTMEDVPFDLRNYRVIQYIPDSPAGFRQVTKQIRENLQQLAQDDRIFDSPVLDSLPPKTREKLDERIEPQTPQERLALDIQAVRTTVEGLGRRLDDDILPRLTAAGKGSARDERVIDWLEQFASRVQPTLLMETYDGIKGIKQTVEGLMTSRKASYLMDEFGLVYCPSNSLAKSVNFGQYGIGCGRPAERP